MKNKDPEFWTILKTPPKTARQTNDDLWKAAYLEMIKALLKKDDKQINEDR